MASENTLRLRERVAGYKRVRPHVCDDKCGKHQYKPSDKPSADDNKETNDG